MKNMAISSVLTLLFALFIGIYVNLVEVPQELDFSDQELAERHGFNSTEHYVTTSDGYVIRGIRIFKGTPKGPPVVFFQYPVASTDVFLINKDTRPPALKVADEGFDVWIISTRDNIKSRQHIKYSNDSSEYWDFSFAHVAQFDLPAWIDSILQETSAPKLGFLGYGYGATALTHLVAAKPHYSELIGLFASIASAGDHFACNSWAMKLMISEPLINAMKLVGKRYMMEPATKTFYRALTAFPLLARFMTKDRFDPYINGDDPEAIPYYAYKFNGGINSEVMRYIGKQTFKPHSLNLMHDFGEETNKLIYNDTTPLVFSYHHLNTNIALIGGKHDKIVTPENIAIYSKFLPRSNIVFYKVDYETDHGGFLFSKNQEYLKDLIQLLSKHLS